MANTIVNSPGKFNLSVAFFQRTPAEFTVHGSDFAEAQKVAVILNQLSHEDGSSNSYCFEGYTKSNIPNKDTREGIYVRGWFRTSDGKGWMSFEKK
jgi:hypothetical protein